MCRIFLSDLDKALQVLRQSDCATPSTLVQDIQGEQGLLQAGAYNQDIPGGVVESFHRGCASKCCENWRGPCPSTEPSSSAFAWAYVTALWTKSATHIEPLFFIAHAKDLGLPTPCPQCVRPFTGSEKCAKEGIRPVSTALDFT